MHSRPEHDENHLSSVGLVSNKILPAASVGIAGVFNQTRTKSR